VVIYLWAAGVGLLGLATLAGFVVMTRHRQSGGLSRLSA
jgi:hypothetical protein